MNDDETNLLDWLTSLNLSTGAKLTYIVLTTVGPGGAACLTQARLAGLVSASVRSVQRHLDELSRHGLISVTRNAASGQSRHVYNLSSPRKLETASRPGNRPNNQLFAL